MSIAEITAIVIELFPEVLDIPILGRLLSAFRQTPFNEARAVEELQRNADRAKQTREKTKRENNKRVLKVSDAIQCVENSLSNGRVLWVYLKNLGRVVTGAEAIDPIDQIVACFLEKRLGQSSPRVAGAKRGYHRPAKGHGRGRSSFG